MAGIVNYIKESFGELKNNVSWTPWAEAMSEEAVGKKWYVVRAVSGQENKIKTYIENEIARLGLKDFVDQVLVPTERVIQIRNGKKIHKEKVFFPGYIMIQANLTGEVPHIIR